MKKISFLILAIFLISLIPVLAQDFDSDFRKKMRAQNSIDTCVRLVNANFPDVSPERARNACADEIRESDEPVSVKPATTALRNIADDGTNIVRLTDAKAVRVDRIKALDKVQMERLENLDSDKLRKISSIKGERLTKIANLDKELLDKLAHFDRARIQKLSELDVEGLKKELAMFRLEKVDKDNRFKKRVVTETRERESKKKFEVKIEFYNDVKEKFKSEKDDWEAAVASGDEEGAIDHAKKFLIHAADMVISSLERVKLNVESNDDLTEEEAAAIIADLDDKIQEMEKAKAEVEEATTKEEVKAAGRSIIKAWERVKNKIKVHIEKVVRAKVGEIIERSEHLETRLERVLAAIEEKGVDVANLDTMVDLFSLRIDEAREKFKIGENLFQQAKDSIGRGQGELIKQAKTFTKEANNALKEAHDILKDIVDALKDAGVEFDIDEEQDFEDDEFELVEIEEEEEDDSSGRDAKRHAEEELVDAEHEIAKATEKIAEREADGKDVSEALVILDKAKTVFADALAAFKAGDYALAEELAEEAEDLAKESREGEHAESVDEEEFEDVCTTDTDCGAGELCEDGECKDLIDCLIPVCDTTPEGCDYIFDDELDSDGCPKNPCGVLACPEDEKALCVQDGGEWKKDGLLGNFHCIHAYSDGDTPCKSSDECMGSCIVTTTEDDAVCERNDSPFGCYSTIENYRETGIIICRD